MDPTKTIYVTRSPFRTPRELETKTANMKEVLNE